MPRKPSNWLLNKFRKSQDDVMGDICNIYRVMMVTGTYSDDEVSVETGTFSLPCGFYFTNGTIKNKNEVIMVDYDVVLRLPADSEVRMTDRIELVTKGQTAVNESFKPHEKPQLGATALVVHLKRTS